MIPSINDATSHKSSVQARPGHDDRRMLSLGFGENSFPRSSRSPRHVEVVFLFRHPNSSLRRSHFQVPVIGTEAGVQPRGPIGLKTRHDTPFPCWKRGVPKTEHPSRAWATTGNEMCPVSPNVPGQASLRLQLRGSGTCLSKWLHTAIRG